jgi:crotonobetainyl-CoA:carnitine CoA-transferase CaiB-like acyl-CoA transferase
VTGRPTVLHDCNVVDLSSHIAGPYCARLLGAAGAAVTKAEWGSGDPLETWAATGRPAPRDGSTMYRFLNAGKRRLRLEPGDDDPTALLREADIIIESGLPPWLTADDLRGPNGQAVVLSISAYGRTGPWSGRSASGLVIDAEAGVLGVLGDVEGPPVSNGVPISEFAAGSYGAVAALAAFRRARATGCGELIDLSLAEAANVTGSNLFPIRHDAGGRGPVAAPSRWLMVPGAERAADGWVGLTFHSRQQFDDFLVMIERFDLLGDDRWASQPYRLAHHEEWSAIVQSWTMARTTAEILTLAEQFRVPAAPVTDGGSVADFEQYVGRGAIGPIDGTSLTGPQVPILLDGERLCVAAEAPRRRDTRRGRRPDTAPAGTAGGRPLTGVRVLDVTNWLAGPIAGQLLAALGADVIHLESHVRLDGGRTLIEGDPVGEWWECGYLFLHANVGKRSLAIDLRTEAGRDAAIDVIKGCDVVIENFAPRVFDQLGLGCDEIRRAAPGTSVVRLPAFGLNGPWRDRVGFGETMEQCSGMAAVTGFPDGPPLIPHGGCDLLAGAHGAFAALLALEHRDRTGAGALMEVPLAEVALTASAAPLLEHQEFGVVTPRRGNRSGSFAPQGVYPCAGTDEWLALTVRTDAEWQALTDVMGRPDWARSTQFETVEDRQRHHDVLDERLAAWTAGQRADSLAEQLTTRGIPAGRCREPRLTAEHPQFVARRLFEEVRHDELGVVRIGAIPFRFASVDAWWRRPPPRLGEHNREVLAEVGRIDEQRLDELEANGVIGCRPVGVE